MSLFVVVKYLECFVSAFRSVFVTFGYAQGENMFMDCAKIKKIVLNILCSYTEESFYGVNTIVVLYLEGTTQN